MTDTRRMTTDRFYGGISNRLQNLRAMLEYVRGANPSRSVLNKWVISSTKAGSEDAVNHHLTFLESIEMIELSNNSYSLGGYGKQWLQDQRPITLYDALSSNVKGFDIILQNLMEGEMTDEDIMDLLVTEFEEAEMTKPGPAIRHREWLQVLGFIEREDGVNRISRNVQNLVADEKSKNKKRPEKGEIFCATIDRISSGNGIITFLDNNVNIGPVKPDSVGKRITAFMIGSKYAVCKTYGIKSENYNNYEKKVSSQYYSKPHTIKKENDQHVSRFFTDTYVPSKVPKIEISTENSPIEFCDDCGSIMKLDSDEWFCKSCGQKKKHKIQRDSSSLKEPKLKSKDAREDSAPDINQLRKEAEEDAVDEVEQTISTITSTKSQYSRSTKVKNYVKARADGTCEGCGEPAPFTSTTGEPYLHAHHVHELSDGGSDTPDTVIALCPNCHYRVHHGEDGDEYNQELLEILQEKESKQS